MTVPYCQVDLTTPGGLATVVLPNGKYLGYLLHEASLY